MGENLDVLKNLEAWEGVICQCEGTLEGHKIGRLNAKHAVHFFSKVLENYVNIDDGLAYKLIVSSINLARALDKGTVEYHDYNDTFYQVEPIPLEELSSRYPGLMLVNSSNGPYLQKVTRLNSIDGWPVDGLEGRKRLVRHILECPRCNKTHFGLVFTAFSKPFLEDDTFPPFNFWSTCPETGEPLLERIDTNGLV